jgi:hypothetical protein
MVHSPAAGAHGPYGRAHGYISSVSAIDPNILGLEARVVGDQLLLRNWSGKTVTIFGTDGAPRLRFAPPGVFLKTGPRWLRVSGGTSFSWHDPRVAWRGVGPPEVVRRAPSQAHFIRRWTVPGTATGTRFVIHGLLGYAPPPKAKPKAKEDGLAWGRWVAIGGGLAAAGLMLLVVGSRSRPRTTGSDPAR